MRTFLVGFIAACFFAIACFLFFDRQTCYGECENGNKHCQDMCLSRDFCPFGGQ